LGVDGSLVCWGSGAPEDAPAGAFAAVAVGLVHGCGLRPGGTVECWGADGRFGFVGGGEAVAPGGVFVAISAGGGRSCGLRPDGVAECWGGDWELEDGVVAPGGEVAAPGGVFEAVSVGYAHACGLRPGGGVACWGTNWFGQAGAPEEGDFVAVTAGASHTCGLRVDGSAACWGADSMDAGAAGSSGFRFGGGEQAYEDYFREEVYWNVASLPRSATLMTIADAVPDVALIGALVERAARWEPPSGPFVALSAGAGFTCGLRADGEVECWGYVADEEPRVPLAVYAEVAGDSIREAHAAKQVELERSWAAFGDKDYWDLDDDERVAVQLGRLELVAYGTMLAYVDLVDPPPGPFLAVDAAGRRVCGLRPGGAVDCWGVAVDADRGPPPGPYATEAPELSIDPTDLDAQHTPLEPDAETAGDGGVLPEVVTVPLWGRPVENLDLGCGTFWMAGERVQLRAGGFAPNSTVSLSAEAGTVSRRDGSYVAELLPPVEVPSATADGEGNLSVIWTVPEAPEIEGYGGPVWYVPKAEGDSARAGVRVEALPVEVKIAYPGVFSCAAVPDAAVTVLGVPVRVDVLANDVAPPGGVLDPASVMVGPAVGGEFVVDPVDGSLTFTPDPGFVGTASARYTVLDSWNGGFRAEVSVTVQRSDP